MAERLVAAFVKKTAMTTKQREGVIALAAEYESVPVDRIVVREVSPAVVLAQGIMNPGVQTPRWEDEYADTDYGYEMFVLDQ